jgi:hypothetical protein
MTTLELAIARGTLIGKILRQKRIAEPENVITIAVFPLPAIFAFKMVVWFGCVGSSACASNQATLSPLRK